MPNPRSGLRMHYRIETSDGAIVDVRTALIDMLRWEKDNGGRSFLEDNTITSALWVAWAAGKRQGVIQGIDQAGWAASVVDFEVITKDQEDAEASEAEAVELNPTQPTPSAS